MKRPCLGGETRAGSLHPALWSSAAVWRIYLCGRLTKSLQLLPHLAVHCSAGKVEDGSFTTMFTHSQNCRRELSTQQGSDVALDGLEAVSFLLLPANAAEESRKLLRGFTAALDYMKYMQKDRQACASRTPSPFSSRSTNNAPACRQFLQPPHVAAGCPHAP